MKANVYPHFHGVRIELQAEEPIERRLLTEAYNECTGERPTHEITIASGEAAGWDAMSALSLVTVTKDRDNARFSLIAIDKIVNSKESVANKALKLIALTQIHPMDKTGYEAWNALRKIIPIEAVNAIAFTLGLFSDPEGSQLKRWEMVLAAQEPATQVR